jgi:hypothetical protein
MNRFLAALVPLTLLLAGWWLTQPEAWVSALRNHIKKSPALVVIADDLAYDPSELGGLIWVPERGLKAEHLNGLQQVLWLRPAQAAAGRLFGQKPRGCRDAHDVQLCVVNLAQNDGMWRLSRNLKGTQFSSPNGRCTAADNTSHCRYGHNGWEYARQEFHPFDGDEQRCIWTHPVADAPVRVQVTGLSPGKYLLSAGIDDGGVASDNASPIELSVAANGGAPRALSVPNQRGMRRFRLPELTAGGGFEMNLSVARTGARFFCWDLSRSAK